jgi:hypothetical protein
MIKLLICLLKAIKIVNPLKIIVIKMFLIKLKLMFQTLIITILINSKRLNKN